MLRLRQRIDRGIYGGHRLRHVALAVGLGLLGGSVTGWNFSVAAVLALAVLVNAHTRLLAASWAAGVLLAALMSGATHFLGVAVLDWAGVGRAVAMLGDGPLAALWGWDQYELIGGATLAAILAMPAARLAARITRSLAWRDESIAAGAADLDSKAAAPPGRVARFAARFLFGFSARERDCRREWAGGWLRPCGLCMAILVMVAAGLAPEIIGPRLATRQLLREFSRANGAEVAAGSFELSLWTGRFSIRDLQVADARHLHRDRLRIGLLSGQLSPGALVRGRLQIEQLALNQVRVDMARHRLARSSSSQEPATEMRSLADAAMSADPSIEIERYVRSWPSVRHDIVWLERLVAAVEAVSTIHDVEAVSTIHDVEAVSTIHDVEAVSTIHDVEAVSTIHDVKAISTIHETRSTRPRRSDLSRPRPRIAIARLRASDLPAGLQLGRKATLELTQLTSRPDLAKRPTRLKVLIPRLAAQLTARFYLNNDAHRHSLKFTAEDLDLAELLDARHDVQTVAAAGRVSLSGEGWMDSRHLELPLRIEIASLDVDVRNQERLAGVESDVWSQGLRRLGAVQTDVLLSGPWSLATLTIEPRRVVDQFKHQLRAAGEYHLVEVIDEQLAESLTYDSPTRVLQAAALESEPPTTAGVSELCDDAAASEPAANEPTAGEMAGSEPGRTEPAPSEFATSKLAPSSLADKDPDNVAAVGEALERGEPASDEGVSLADQLTSSLTADEAYPTTAAPYDEGDDYDARYDAPPAEPAPPQPEPAFVARREQGSRRTAQLPGPLGLAIGHDPLDGPEQAPPNTTYQPVQYVPPRAAAQRQPIPPAQPPEPPAGYGEPANGAPPYVATQPRSASYPAAQDPTAPYPAARQPNTTYGTMPDDISANGPADPEPDTGAEPPHVVRPSLLTRWSNGLRNRFARKPARGAEPAPSNIVDPPEYNGQVFDAPAYEAPSDDDSEKPLAADHPWYKRLFR